MRFPLLTARLALRPFALTDVPVMHRIYGDAAVMRYVGTGRVSDIAVTESMLTEYVTHQETHGFSVWALVERASNEVIGDAGLQMLGGGPEVELGYTLGSAWWGRGYATEAGRACVAAGFHDAGLKLLVALTDPANAASVRVLQKLGFEHRGTRHAFGRQHDLYALTSRLLRELPTAAAIEDGGLRAGATVGGYSLERELGRGGMGVVYQAWDNELQRAVALKVIAPSYHRDRAFRERFRRESRLMATIEHPNVVPVYRAGQDRGRLYVAMRLIDGTDLREILIARGKLDPDLAVRMTGQIAAALDAAHDRGLLHRDVKPANILVNGAPGQEHAFLTDFGIAKLAAREGLTKTGEVVGTLDYLAPEVLRGEPVDRRADVYALGCVLFELFTGTVPYPRDSDAGRIAAHLHDTPPTVSERGFNVRRSLDKVVRRALAKRPAQRFSSPGELARAALQALEEPSGGRRSPRSDQVGSNAALGRTSATGRSDLRPAETPLIGRERESEELARLCTASDGRVLTIVGPGGSGKTSLAVATADALLDHFDDGVFIVALEGVGDPDAVPSAIARQLGLPHGGSPSPLAALIAHLHERCVLLLLDNFEHLMGAAVAVGEIAAGAPRTRILVTSQAPLKIRAEHVFALRGLTLPPSDIMDLAVLSRVPSVALLLERTRAFDAGFSLAEDNGAAVRELCAALDGIPLAIELAAARMTVVTPAQLLNRVERGIDALGHGARDLPSRQRGLRAMLDWTCSLLSAAELNLLMKIAVFVGGFTLELAEAINDDDVLEAVATLRDVSLAHRGSNGRLSLPPPVRAYALENLRASEEHAARRRHAEALLTLTEPRSAIWFRAVEDLMLTLEPEADNLRAAMSWTRSHDIALHGRLAVSTALWLVFRGGHPATTEIDAALRNIHGRRLEAELLLAHTAVTSPFGELAVADRAVEAWRELGDHTQLAMVLLNRARTRAHHGQPSAALMDAKEAQGLAESVGDEDLRDLADLDYAHTLLLAGASAEAITVLGPLAERARPGSFVALGAAASVQADAALAEGRNELALAGYGRALAQMRPISTPPNVAFQVEGIAMALAGLDRPEESIKAMALAEKLRREFSCAAPPDWLADVETTLHPMRAALSPEQIERYRSEVETLDLERGLAWIASLTTPTDAQGQS